jgi:arylsulfatase A-like enzyme
MTKKKKRPNIIFIVLDTQRVDALSCYGHTVNTSPCLDRLAEDGTLYEQAVSPAQWTIPAHASMFTGQYPLLHQTVQSDRSLPPDLPTVTELLQQNGYHTFAFCNNPLVGVLNTGLQRGFREFFNYASFFPDLVPSPKVAPNPLSRSMENARGGVKSVVRHIERQFGKSEWLLALSQESFFVPFWSRLGSFKGNVIRSMGDATRYARAYHDDEQPYFMFINLMETHLPYWPAKPFVRKYASWVGRDVKARMFMSKFNTQAYRWATPIIQPLSELEWAALHAMYDAEVAFQDHHMGRLFKALDEMHAFDDTLVIVVSDHGEGFGEHNYMGHAFSLYQEVVHVPLVVRFPGGQHAGVRVKEAVSTRRIFHTILESAGILAEDPLGTVDELSLRTSAGRRIPANELVISEAYSPTNFVSVIERRDPEVLVPFQCLSLWRAAYRDSDKVIAIDGEPEKYYRLDQDPGEQQNLANAVDGAPELFSRLSSFLDSQQEYAHATHHGGDYSKDEEAEIERQLRGLGYMG